MAAWNMYIIENNMYEKLCVKLVIYKDHTRMHGQQNIKSYNFLTLEDWTNRLYRNVGKELPLYAA